MFTDRDCVNRVFTGYPVSSPAFAPRSYGGQALAEGKQLMADGTQVKPTELVHDGTGPAKIDLWDTTGRYYAVAVPVVVTRDAPASDASRLAAGRPHDADRHDATGTTQTVTTQSGTPPTDSPGRRGDERSSTRTSSFRRTSARGPLPHLRQGQPDADPHERRPPDRDGALAERAAPLRP